MAAISQAISESTSVISPSGQTNLALYAAGPPTRRLRVTIGTPSMKKTNDLKRQINEAILACQDKKAEQVTVLELEKDSGAFTDYFVMCNGTNPRQIQAIADAVEERLKALALRPAHTEGYKQAEWVLLDYVDFVVHIFSEKARQFYDLERLWKSAKRLEAAELMPKPKARRATAIQSTPPTPPPKKTRKKNI